MPLNTIPNKGLTSRGYPSDRLVTPIIINGDMSIAQRGTSSTSTGYVVDRFNFRVSNTDQFAYTHSQSTTVPTGQGFSNSWKLDVTTAETTLDSDEEVAFQTRLEAQNLQSLKFGTSSAETLSLSFWVRSNKTGTYGIYLRQHDAGKNYVASYTISSADIWEKKIVTISGNTADTIANDNGIGFWINWTLAAGSSLDGATMNSWHTAATEIAPTGQVNITDSTSNEWYITGVQLEVGEFDSTTIPSFPFESFDVNFKRCMRYLQHTPYITGANSMTAPTNEGIEIMGARHKFADVHGYRTQTITHYVPMRAQPTLTFYNPSNSGTTGQFRLYDKDGNTQDFSGFTQLWDRYGFNMAGYTGVSVGTAGDSLWILGMHWKADAEL